MDGDFIKIMGLALGGKEIGGKLGSIVWWNNFGEGFAWANISVRKKRSCRSSLCIHGS